IEESRRNAIEMEREAQRAKHDAESVRDEYEQRVREVEDVRRSVRQNAEEEARMVLRRVSERAENILEELKKMNRGSRKGATARKLLTDLRRETASELESTEQESELFPALPAGHIFRRGD